MWGCVAYGIAINNHDCSIPTLPPPPTSSGSTAAQNAASKRLQQTQAQVNEVVGIMKVNVEKVLERDQKLSELDARADALQSGASQFEQQASKLKRKHWWANMKMMIIMGVIGLILLIVIIGELCVCLCGVVDFFALCCHSSTFVSRVVQDNRCR